MSPRGVAAPCIATGVARRRSVEPCQQEEKAGGEARSHDGDLHCWQHILGDGSADDQGAHHDVCPDLEYPSLTKL